MPTDKIIDSAQWREAMVSGQEKDDDQKPKTEDQILTENGFYWRETGDVKVLVCRALEEKGFVNGFSTRIGGVSDFPKESLNLSGFDIDSAENITENRSRFLKAFEGDFQIVTAWQVHGDNIKVVANSDQAKETNETFDALVSNLSGILVGVKTADCVPVLIGDVRTKAFAAVHAGWRGTVQSIVPETIIRMTELYGTRSEDLTVAIGAAALACCYEIGQDVMDAFERNFPNSGNLFAATRDAHALVDLHQANREQLLSAGVQTENIYTAPLCTMERTDLFFSYRQEKKLYGKTGRLLSVIGKQNNLFN
jgi:YfiH family protein